MSGIRTVLLVFLLASARQEPSLDALVEQLSHDRVEQREAAVEGLVRLGPDRLPELRKRLDGLAPEPKGRLAAAIRRIEASVRLLDYFPPYRPVSLNVTKVPVRDALKELADRTGLPIDLSTCPAGREVTVQVDDVPPLQALTEVCRAAMIGWMDRTPTDWRGRRLGSQPPGIRLHEVVPHYYRPMAIQVVRHYRIQAHFSTISYTTGAKWLQLNLTVEPASGVRPHSVTGIRLTEASDEKGQDVLASFPSKGVMFHTLGIGRTHANYSKMLPMETAPQKLTRLKGSVTFRYPREVHWVRFPNPAEGQPAPVTALGCRISLGEYQRQGKHHEVMLIVTPLEGGPIKGSDPETNLPVDFQEVELVSASGERLVSNGYSGSGGRGTMVTQLTLSGSKDEAAAEIRFPWADSFVEDAVEFDLRDVVHQ